MSRMLIVASLLFFVAQEAKASQDESEDKSIDDVKALAELHSEWYSYFIKRTLIPEYEHLMTQIWNYCASKGPIYLEYSVVFEINENGFVDSLYFEQPEYEVNCVKQQLKRMPFSNPPVAPFYLRIKHS